MTLTEKYTIWIQIAFGIANLHQKGLIYRDLKPENILIDIHERVRVCDFGFACKIMPNQKLTSLCGSYEYIAPEMLKKEGYDKAIDLYCLGLLFYELLVGTNPFEGITPKNVMEMKSKPINLEKKQISNTVKDLLKKLLK
jgi:serine/threonine protein kinase